MHYDLFIIIVITRVNKSWSKVCSKQFTCIILNHHNTWMRNTFIIVFILLIYKKKTPEAQDVDTC